MRAGLWATVACTLAVVPARADVVDPKIPIVRVAFGESFGWCNRQDAFVGSTFACTEPLAVLLSMKPSRRASYRIEIEGGFGADSSTSWTDGAVGTTIIGGPSFFIRPMFGFDITPDQRFFFAWVPSSVR